MGLISGHGVPSVYSGEKDVGNAIFPEFEGGEECVGRFFGLCVSEDIDEDGEEGSSCGDALVVVFSGAF